MPFLLIEQKNNIATITLNRPDVHNAFDEHVIAELISVLEKIDSDPAIRVVILKAHGKSFCAGADLMWMQKMANYSYEENLQDSQQLARLMKELYHLNKPTIAAIQGSAFGGGVGLVACCDIAIASENAHFCFSEVKLGLIPAVISPYIVSAVGARNANRYILTAEKFNAKAALEMGLIHQVVSTEQLENQVHHFSELLIQNGPEALKLSKKLIRTIAPITDSIEKYTVESIAKARVSEEAQERLKKFLEK